MDTLAQAKFVGPLLLDSIATGCQKGRCIEINTSLAAVAVSKRSRSRLQLSSILERVTVNFVSIGIHYHRWRQRMITEALFLQQFE